MELYFRITQRKAGYLLSCFFNVFNKIQNIFIKSVDKQFYMHIIIGVGTTYDNKILFLGGIQNEKERCYERIGGCYRCSKA
jgi:hypothetical protein